MYRNGKIIAVTGVKIPTGELSLKRKNGDENVEPLKKVSAKRDLSQPGPYAAKPASNNESGTRASVRAAASEAKKTATVAASTAPKSSSSSLKNRRAVADVKVSASIRQVTTAANDTDEQLMREQAEALRIEAENARGEIEAARSETCAARAEADAARAEADVARAEAEALRADNDALRVEASKAIAEFAIETTMRRDLGVRAQALQAELVLLKEVHATCVSELGAMTNRAETAEALAAAQREEIDGLKQAAFEADDLRRKM